jgi:hypothetical protein
LTFLFQFTKCWGLGLPLWIAPLVGLVVDLSVVGLLLARRFPTMHGVVAGPCAQSSQSLNRHQFLPLDQRWQRQARAAGVNPPPLAGWPTLFLWDGTR